MAERSSVTAAVIARWMLAQGIDRLFGLCGGHIMPIWMEADAAGIRIIDVRDERAAVHMAQAHADLTGQIGVALVTAGPGVTNAMTGIVNAHVARAPVLILSGVPPAAQENRGGLQDIDHISLVRSVTRYARTVREPALVLQELDEALARALGQGGEPGPAYVDFPVDTLRATVPRAVQLEEYFAPRPPRAIMPDLHAVERAVELLFSSRRILLISGRGARPAGPEIVRLLDRLGAVYLDTAESRGLVSDDHPASVASMRAAVMGEADLVVTIGRRLDFQLAFGSPAVFSSARFLRIADTPSELRDNRRGAVEILGSPKASIAAILEAAGDRPSSVDGEWVSALRQKHHERVSKMRKTMATAEALDGKVHPNQLLAALQMDLPENGIVVADGGDSLSFTRVGLSAGSYLDPGPFGCLGVGVPYGIAASLAFPERLVTVVTGDGSFGFNAIEVDTAVRHKAPLLLVVMNNGAWQIEVYDQNTRFGRVAGTRLQSSDYAGMARAFGMYAERVERPEEIREALARALANRPALLDVIVTPDVISGDAKSGLAEVPDLQALSTWDEAERAWRES